MPLDERVREIATRLLEKTAKREASWEELGSRTGPMYSLDLGNARVVIRFHSPSTEPDFYELTLQNSEKQTAGEWFIGEGDPDWNLVWGLYLGASRAARKLDDVLDEIEKAVGTSGAIGAPRSATIPSREESIPF